MVGSYRPFDQKEKLGEPPWDSQDARVVEWEIAHNHDVRTKCYMEYGCLVVESFLEQRIGELENFLQEFIDLGFELEDPYDLVCLHQKAVELLEDK